MFKAIFIRVTNGQWIVSTRSSELAIWIIFRCCCSSNHLIGRVNPSSMKYYSPPQLALPRIAGIQIGNHGENFCEPNDLELRTLSKRSQITPAERWYSLNPLFKAYHLSIFLHVRFLFTEQIKQFSSWIMLLHLPCSRCSWFSQFSIQIHSHRSVRGNFTHIYA